MKWRATTLWPVLCSRAALGGLWWCAGVQSYRTHSIVGFHWQELCCPILLCGLDCSKQHRNSLDSTKGKGDGKCMWRQRGEGVALWWWKTCQTQRELDDTKSLVKEEGSSCWASFTGGCSLVWRCLWRWLKMPLNKSRVQEVCSSPSIWECKVFWLLSASVFLVWA